MSRHTPGPWEVVGRSIFQADAVGGRQIVHGSAIKGRNSTEEIDANTRLIAAAPDLLKALKELTPDQMPPINAICHEGICSQSECAYCQRIARALAAISRAEGKS